jgi:hypothetical protein
VPGRAALRRPSVLFWPRDGPNRVGRGAGRCSPDGPGHPAPPRPATAGIGGGRADGMLGLPGMDLDEVRPIDLRHPGLDGFSRLLRPACF